MTPHSSLLTPHDDQCRKVLIVTGEASGDLHGARLIRAMRERRPEVHFQGVGGQRMAAAGCEILIRGEDLAVVGLVEVLSHFPTIWRAFQSLKKRLYGPDRPDALVLIDFPDFNLRLAKVAKRAGVPVLYYVSPQVWAWRRGRVKKIAAVVDSLAAIFPFEPELYRGLDIDVEYVGHPLLDEFAIGMQRAEFRAAHDVPLERTVVGLFPGSRASELHYMLDTLVATAHTLCARRDNLHFLVPIAPSLAAAAIASRFAVELPVTFVETADANIYDLANACDAVVSVSGTVTLQVALAGVPMTILYKVAPLTYAIGKRLIKIEHIGLANIVAGQGVVREFIQQEATAENLAKEIERIISDPEYAHKIRAGLSVVREKLGEPGCAARVAAMLDSLLSR
ncbi:MAG: lipid-A-disaccharide synthase [Desulfuromonadales bacterium]|nr:lipid-A-disaccharide synthase [Desulfuromonadales bacterium]